MKPPWIIPSRALQVKKLVRPLSQNSVNQILDVSINILGRSRSKEKNSQDSSDSLNKQLLNISPKGGWPSWAIRVSSGLLDTLPTVGSRHGTRKNRRKQEDGQWCFESWKKHSVLNVWGFLRHSPPKATKRGKHATRIWILTSRSYEWP